MMSVVSAQSGHVLADQRDAVEEALAAVGAAHPLEHARGARLQRQVDVLADGLELGVGADDVLGHVRRVRARVADALDAVDRVDRVQQLGELARLRAQARAVGVDVLAEQRDLAHALGGEHAHLVDELLERPRDLAAARRRHDAERALHVAAGADLHPGVDVAGALAGQVAGEALELEEALGGQRVAGQELGELVHLAGPERDVDERELREHLVLHRLRPAAADADHALGIAALERPRLVQVRDEALVGLLADRAGVEEDQVRVLALRHLGVAERLEHALHALGVVLVHLAPEGGDVEALHRRASERSRWRATPG